MPFKYIVCLFTVNISNFDGDASDSSGLSSKAVKSGLPEVQRTENKQREEKQTRNTRNDAVFQVSSSISDSQSVPNHKKHKRNQQSNGRQTAFKTSKVAVDSTAHLAKENEDDGISTEETLTSSSQDKTEGIQRYKKKDETEEEKERLSIGEKNEVATRYSTQNHEKRAGLCEERDKEDKERVEEQSSTDEEEAQEEDALKSNTSVTESLLEDVHNVRQCEGEEEIAGEEEDEDREKGVEKSRASGRRSKEHDNGTDLEGNYNEVLASTSVRSIQDR